MNRKIKDIPISPLLENNGGDGMITLTVYYTDGSVTKYMCEKVRYDARVIFAETDGGKKLCIPYANVYVVIEEWSET